MSNPYPDKDGNWFIPGNEDCCSCCEECYKRHEEKILRWLRYNYNITDNVKFIRYQEKSLLEELDLNPKAQAAWEAWEKDREPPVTW
jgi:hypothetical protein